MNHKQFIIKLQEFYKPFKNKTVEEVTTKYITDVFKESELDAAFIKIVSGYEYATCPGPAQLNKIFDIDGRLEIKALSAWVMINNKLDSGADIIFEDIRLQLIIQSMGGWVAFCRRPNDSESEKWAQKDFINKFKLFTDNKPDVQPRVLKGSHSHRIIMIGDKEKCKQLIGQKTNSGIENKVKDNINLIV